MVVPFPDSGKQLSTSEDIDAVVADFSDVPGVVGIRVLGGGGAEPDSPSVRIPELFGKVASACVRRGLPLFMWVPGQLELVEAVAAGHPELTVIVDHLGLFQPPHHERGPDPFADLKSLLDLSRFPNVAVKVSGLPTLSKSQFPYADLWHPLKEIVTAFGHDRALWGSDISRVDGRIGVLSHGRGRN